MNSEEVFPKDSRYPDDAKSTSKAIFPPEVILSGGNIRLGPPKGSKFRCTLI